VLQNVSINLAVKRPCLGVHSHSHAHEAVYGCVCYSKHKFACIPKAAVHINTSTIMTCMGCCGVGPVSRQPYE